MEDDNHGAKTQEESQAQEDLGQQQAERDRPQVRGTDWEKAVAERDEKISALEAQIAEAAKNAEAADQLRGEIAELKAQGESDRIDFKLQFAGVRNVKTARGVLDDHGGDVGALKEASHGCLPTCPPSSRAVRPVFPTRAPARTPARR